MIYTQTKLNQDVLDQTVEYIANSISDIRNKEIDFINKSNYRFSYDYHINKTNLDFNQSISPLKDYYPKTYDYLVSHSLSYQSIISWYEIIKKELSLISFFELNQRIYFLTDPSEDYYHWLPNYLKDGWLKAFGGVLLSDGVRYIQGGTMLIGDPYSCWKAFELYLPNSRKKAKQAIESLVKKIPYAFVDSDIQDIEKQEKCKKDGFPNLRVMIDCCKPDEDPQEYDLILMCYDYDHRVFWVKDGDFINGLYEITQPKEMLDEYFLHVFSQSGEEYSRFEFSRWANHLN